MVCAGIQLLNVLAQSSRQTQVDASDQRSRDPHSERDNKISNRAPADSPQRPDRAQQAVKDGGQSKNQIVVPNRPKKNENPNQHDEEKCQACKFEICLWQAKGKIERSWNKPFKRPESLPQKE